MGAGTPGQAVATPGGAQLFPAGQGCTGLDWAALDWTGLDWAGLGCLVSVLVGIALSRQPAAEVRSPVPSRAVVARRGSGAPSVSSRL